MVVEVDFPTETPIAFLIRGIVYLLAFFTVSFSVEVFLLDTLSHISSLLQ